MAYQKYILYPSRLLFYFLGIGMCHSLFQRYLKNYSKMFQSFSFWFNAWLSLNFLDDFGPGEPIKGEQSLCDARMFYRDRIAR